MARSLMTTNSVRDRFSAGSGKAFDTALTMAQPLDARLTIAYAWAPIVAVSDLHVVGSITDWPSLDRERELQERVREEAQARLEQIQQARWGYDSSLSGGRGDRQHRR
jgi:hypothetical protein